MRLDTKYPKKDRFKRLGSIIQGREDIEDDITHSSSVVWMKWGLAFGVVCDKRYNQNLKVSSIEW